jgi:hypothetical protein
VVIDDHHFDWSGLIHLSFPFLVLTKGIFVDFSGELPPLFGLSHSAERSRRSLGRIPPDHNSGTGSGFTIDQEHSPYFLYMLTYKV